MKKTLGCLTWIAGFVIALALIAKFFFVDMAIVGHNAMAPTMLTGERVLIWKRGEPKLGAMSVCTRPRVGGLAVGRVVATSKMSVAADDNRLRINNKALDVNLKSSTAFYNADHDQNDSLQTAIEFLTENEDYMVFLNSIRPMSIAPTRVPDGHVYLLADNRGYPSADSRSFGAIPVSSCRGNVVFRLTPSPGLSSELEHGYFELLD